MAPKNRKPKGLTRMDAALDAMRPMGFKPDRVRKCVRDLLKVYGNDGWSFIEDGAYNVLLETMLELDEEPLRLEHVPKPLLEGNADDSPESPLSEPIPCKAVVLGGEEANQVNPSSLQMLLKEINAIKKENEGESLDAVITPNLLEGASATQSQDGAFIDLAPGCTPQAKDAAPKTRKPSYGWIDDDNDDDDDEDGDFLQLDRAN